MDQVEEHGWEAPLYWEHKENHSSDRENQWVKKDFRGMHEIEANEPVVNVSYYEADAYATWAGNRLPTEAKWEKVACWNEDLQKKTVYPWGDNLPQSRHPRKLIRILCLGPYECGLIS